MISNYKLPSVCIDFIEKEYKHLSKVWAKPLLHTSASWGSVVFSEAMGRLGHYVG
jgi:hypothetical protein